MSDKSFLPIAWPMWMLFFLIINAVVLSFVVKLSFEGWIWESALNATLMDRSVSLAALGLLIVDIWFVIGMVRLIQRKWKEMDFLDE